MTAKEGVALPGEAPIDASQISISRCDDQRYTVGDPGKVLKLGVGGGRWGGTCGSYARFGGGDDRVTTWFQGGQGVTG